MSQALLHPLLPAYGLAPDAPMRLLNLSENETWQAGEGEETLVLRLHRTGYHTRDEIASELAWLQALNAQTELRCVRPRADRDGRLIQEVAGRHIVGFDFIAGKEPAPHEDLRPWFGELGAITARLHEHAAQWQRPAGFSRKSWTVETILGPRPHWGDWHQAEGLDPQGEAVLARLSDDLAMRLHAYGTDAHRFGLIHADLRLANLLIDEGAIWSIDFDDCGFGWRMYDFAAAVSFIETDPRLPDLAALWLEGYRRSGTAGTGDEAILPVMVMLRRILLTAWLGTRKGTDTANAFGGPAFTSGTVELAERFLVAGPTGFWST
jgi:Ser/Thr protein kinase RdoA (MazF antagonist)